LPVKQFIAATNTNDVVPEYLQSGLFAPRPSKQTISNAMDVGHPSNFARMQDLYQGSLAAMRNDITGYHFTDEETGEAMRSVLKAHDYVLDPHGAVGYLGLKKYMETQANKVHGVYLETAHPGKFKEVVEEVLSSELQLPDKLNAFLSRDKKSMAMKNEFQQLKSFLMTIEIS